MLGEGQSEQAITSLFSVLVPINLISRQGSLTLVSQSKASSPAREGGTKTGDKGDKVNMK